MSSVAATKPISPAAERNMFVRRNQGLVNFIARKYLNRGLSFEDLMQEGNIGLLRAIRGFDPARGYEFSTYAARCIRNAIKTAIRTNSRHHKESISLNDPVFRDELNGPTLMDRHAVTQPDQEIITDLKDALPRLLTALSPSETRALELTLIEGMSLVEAGEIMGVSRERSRQLQEEAIQKIKELDAGSGQVVPFIKWLNDEGALALMSKTLTPEEKVLLEISFIRWVSRAKAASPLGVSPAEITKQRLRLFKKLNQMYEIIEKVGPQNIKSLQQLEGLRRLTLAAARYLKTHPDETRVPFEKMLAATGTSRTLLRKIAVNYQAYLRAEGIKFRTRPGNGKDLEVYALTRLAEIQKESAPKDKTDLCRKLGICKFTLRSWQNASKKVQTAVAEIVSIGKKTTWRLHRHEQLPAEKRTALFAHGYNTLTAPERDLGREPIAIAEIASVISYDAGTIMSWITASPEKSGPNAILYLKSFSLPKTFTLELRRRRISWALNFARENGFRYLNPVGFAKERLNITRLALRNWMMEDPEVANIFAEYPGVLGGRPKNIAA